MQRLYFTFPNAWPGAGLLMLRAAIGLLMISCREWDYALPWQTATLTIEVLASGMLLVGLWTPVAAIIVAVLEAVSIQTLDVTSRIHIVGALLALSLGMLGPGAWSFDARIFGRKRIRIEDIEE